MHEAAQPFALEGSLTAVPTSDGSKIFDGRFLNRREVFAHIRLGTWVGCCRDWRRCRAATRLSRAAGITCLEETPAGVAEASSSSVTRRRPGGLQKTPQIGKALPGRRPTMRRQCEPVRSAGSEFVGRVLPQAATKSLRLGSGPRRCVEAYSGFRAGFEKRLFRLVGNLESQMPPSAYFA